MSRENQTTAEQTADEPTNVSVPKIAGILESHRGKRHVIVMHNYPDPDAISSALAHQLISAEFNIETDIIYHGTISHPQNIALVRLLGVQLTSFSESLNLQQYDGAVFVDNQGTTCEEIVQALEAVDVPTLIIVDHHDLQERLHAEFTDIRRYGAVATIYTEYIKSGLVKMNSSTKKHVNVATALMHGIMTDTSGFTQAGSEEFMAAAFLSQFRDAQLLKQIMTQSQSKHVMEIIRRALGDRMTVEGFSIAGIGYVRVEDRDAIPQAADFLLTEENIHTAIVYGVVTGSEQSETLIGSLRTSKITIGPDDFIKSTFGQDESGRYFGGGKHSAGGFEISLGFLSGDSSDEYRRLKWQVYDQQIKLKIFNKIGVQIDL